MAFSAILDKFENPRMRYSYRDCFDQRRYLNLENFEKI